jgi:hypothetical protein
LHVVKLVLEAGDDVAHALDELQRLGLARGVDQLAIHVKRVLHGNDYTVINP